MFVDRADVTCDRVNNPRGIFEHISGTAMTIGDASSQDIHRNKELKAIFYHVQNGTKNGGGASGTKGEGNGSTKGGSCKK
ncbi:hypothetical protein GYMLUDRAFT_50216 [Collybiopsis luxurians FD-317 M1]|uniref:Uncharacterized protein n=1 Tax=Collybiopsis luxurians FD-317 M1 TaxID=944289 RepID=A0A0D0AP59_9AGAR|nr:hypothetical protein GYMLUDRAFT_50216 [Collybiopsis luxurians FD-317 M1]